MWSFPTRGTWAIHDSSYRGNWAPQIPRNLILLYSREGDLVVDPFCGGGTTAIECLLLGRKCIAIDINPMAIEQTKRKIRRLQEALVSFSTHLPKIPLIQIVQGDARSMGFIRDGSVQLICAHPPYLDSIRYTSNASEDLSNIKKPQQFYEELKKVARECHRILKPSGYCAVLIGDIRRDGNLITLGFGTMQVFVDSGFRVHEIIIKDQHQGSMTQFWRRRVRNGKHTFLLLAHEYLFVFRKA